MSLRDEEIGELVQKMRGEMSQKQLAEAMRAHGWKWTQTTVWNVEKGERPLRLGEAQDLAQVTGTSLVSFMDSPRAFDLRAQARKIEGLVDEVTRLLDEIENAQIDLAWAADSAPEEVSTRLAHDHISHALEVTPAKILENYELNRAANGAKEAVLSGIDEAEESSFHSSGRYGSLIGLQMRSVAPEEDSDNQNNDG